MLRKLRLFVTMLILAAVVLQIPAYAASQTELGEPELTIYCHADQENLVGVTFELYQVAELTGNGAYRVTERFSQFDEAVKDISDPHKLAAALEYYVLEHELESDGICTSGQDGIARLPQSGETLEEGLYLVLGRRHVQNGYIYELNPMLVSFPRYDESTKEFSNQVQIKPKYNRSPVPEDGKVDRKVLKIWQDKGHASDRPTQVVVKLLKNRKVYDTVILSKDNQWSYSWENLSASAEWTILEEPVENYTPSVTRKGITFTLTNTYNPPGPPTEPPTEPPTTPGPPPKLPQTGQLWWPVPILLLAGMVFVVIGIIRRREDYYED